MPDRLTYFNARQEHPEIIIIKKELRKCSPEVLQDNKKSADSHDYDYNDKALL